VRIVSVVRSYTQIFLITCWFRKAWWGVWHNVVYLWSKSP